MQANFSDIFEPPISLKPNHFKKHLSHGTSLLHTPFTSHSAYVAASTELHGVKIDGFLYPNFK